MGKRNRRGEESKENEKVSRRISRRSRERSSIKMRCACAHNERGKM